MKLELELTEEEALFFIVAFNNGISEMLKDIQHLPLAKTSREFLTLKEKINNTDEFKRVLLDENIEAFRER